MRKNIRYDCSGASLVEALIAFSSFLLLVTLLVPSISVLKQPQHMKGNWLKPMEVELFFQQVTIELRKATDIWTNAGKLYFHNQDGKIVSFERYGKMVRRRVNNHGHEILLMNIHSVNFTLVNDGVIITIEDQNNTYSKRLSTLPLRNEQQ
jgi:competence protein ComGF